MQTSRRNPGYMELVNQIALGAVAVTPNDSTDLSGGATKGLYLGASGNVSVVMEDGTSVTFTNLASGMIHPISVTRVKATSTTATGIVAVY